MKHLRLILPLLCVLASHPAVSVPQTVAADDVQVTGCFLSLKDEAQIPARERGVLREISVEPGDDVSEGQVIAVLEDRDALLALQLARLDLDVAEKRCAEGVTVNIAEAAVNESASMTEQARLDQQISSQMAESDIAVRQAKAAGELARDALNRAKESREEFPTSVSSREMATLQYDVDKAVLDVELAEYERALQSLRVGSQAAVVAQRETAERRRQLELREARLDQDIAVLTVQQMKTAVEVASERVDRTRMTSPLTGLAVEKLHHVGEWVEIGEPVLRVVRLDVLFVEGYADAELVDQSFRGHEVSVTGSSRGGAVSVSGQVVFVSPEIDPVNGQVKVRAEIRNQRLQLRPGQQVEMVIRGE